VLDYQLIVDSFAHVHQDLWQYFLSNEKWEVIELVAKWLKCFHTETTQMSATHMPMISTMHAIFHGLHEDICHILSNPPNMWQLAVHISSAQSFTVHDICVFGGTEQLTSPKNGNLEPVKQW